MYRAREISSGRWMVYRVDGKMTPLGPIDLMRMRLATSMANAIASFYTLGRSLVTVPGGKVH